MSGAEEEAESEIDEEETAEEREARHAERDRMSRELGRALHNAYRMQPKNVVYPDYKKKEDFPVWLQGYREKIRNAYGYTAAQDDAVNAEVVRSISGKLSSGGPLDAYNRLTGAVREEYERLIEALTEEFLNPQKKQRFLANFKFNTRKKGESLKDYMEEIIKDQNRYSGMPDYIGTGNQKVENMTKVKDGIRRFVSGIRTRKGKKNSDQQRHLRYSLMKDSDMTWENALDIAIRWEGANEGGLSHSSSNDSSSASSDEEVDALAEGKGCKSKSKKKKKGKKREKEAPSVIIATLSERVETNARDIRGIKNAQERMDANIASWKEETRATMDEILQIVKPQPQQEFSQHQAGQYQ